MKHFYFKICECCGAHLDPGEQCDCRKKVGTVVNAGKTDDHCSSEEAQEEKKGSAAWKKKSLSLKSLSILPN